MVTLLYTRGGCNVRTFLLVFLVSVMVGFATAAPSPMPSLSKYVVGNGAAGETPCGPMGIVWLDEKGLEDDEFWEAVAFFAPPTARIPFLMGVFTYPEGPGVLHNQPATSVTIYVDRNLDGLAEQVFTLKMPIDPASFDICKYAPRRA